MSLGVRKLIGTAREATRCPIFLLQVSSVEVTVDFCHADWEWGEEGEMKHVESGKTMSGRELDDFLISRGQAKRCWTTWDGGVWFTREEAEAEGERRDYYYGRKNKDWRVFCVCAQGKLEELLNIHSEYEER